MALSLTVVTSQGLMWSLWTVTDVEIGGVGSHRTGSHMALGGVRCVGGGCFLGSCSVSRQG